MAHAIAYGSAVKSSPRGPGSRILGVHHLSKAACLIGSGLHCMQTLVGFESPKFRSESRPASERASRKGARPCPQRMRGEGCVTLAFPHDTNCIRPRVQGSWVVWDWVMRYVDELRHNGVLRSSSRTASNS